MAEGTQRKSSWWIWLLLLALLALILWCVLGKRQPIQGAVAACVLPTMQSYGISESSYRVDGRDVFLEGDITNAVDREALVSELEGQDCTARVTDRFNAITMLPASMQLNRVGDKVTLTGNMPNQESIDVVANSAVENFGSDMVDNQMQVVANTTDPVWLNGIDGYVDEIKIADPAGIDATDERVLLSGVVRSEGDKMSLGEKATAAFASAVPVTNNIEVRGPTNSSQITYRVADGDKVTLTGTLADQAAVDTAVGAANDVYGADNVTNQLQISEEAMPANWLGGLSGALPGLTGASGAALMASNDGVILEGLVDAQDKRTSIEDAAKAAFGSDVSIDNRITVEVPRTSSNIVMDMPDGAGGKVTLTGDMPDQSALGDAAGAAGMLFGADNIVNNMTATDTVMSPAWMTGLGGVVKSYGDADNGRITANDAGIVLEGLVDSQDKRSAIGAAAASTGLPVDNRIEVRARGEGNVAYVWDGSRIKLSGELASQGEVDSAVAGAAGVVGASNVDSSLTVGDRLGDSVWLPGVIGMLGDLNGMEEAAIRASNSGVVIEGLLEYEASGNKSTIGGKAQSSIDGGVGIDNRIRVKQQEIAQIDLRGVQFETNSDRLTTESLVILDQAVEVLARYPNVRVEVSGHTDSRGDDAYNQNLSALRATSVVNYLVSNGIGGDRLEPRGYGESRPIADNDTAEGLQMNRRIEFEVLSQ